MFHTKRRWQPEVNSAARVEAAGPSLLTLKAEEEAKLMELPLSPPSENGRFPSH